MMHDDQAAGLRRKISRLSQKQAKTIAIVSGKGGVGKSNICVNIAVELTRNGNRVLIADMDVGMGNIHLLTGQQTDRSMADFFEKNIPLSELVIKGDQGFSYISGGSGLSRLVDWKDETLQKWLYEMERLSRNYDYLLFDMGAGASKEALAILMSVEDVFVVTTPEPTAVMDAYSIMKYICVQQEESSLHLLCNRAGSMKEGRDTLYRLQEAVRKFLGRNCRLLGVLPESAAVKQAVYDQIPFIVAHPNKKVSICLRQAVKTYMDNEQPYVGNTGREPFIFKFRRFLQERGMGK